MRLKRAPVIYKLFKSYRFGIFKRAIFKSDAARASPQSWRIRARLTRPVDNGNRCRIHPTKKENLNKQARSLSNAKLQPGESRDALEILATTCAIIICRLGSNQRSQD